MRQIDLCEDSSCPVSVPHPPHEAIERKRCFACGNEYLVRVEEKLPLHKILGVCANYYGIPVGQVTGPSREKRTVRVRHIAMYLARLYTDLSLSDIGFVFQRHHSTVLLATQKISSRVARDKNLKEQIQDILEEVRT